VPATGAFILAPNHASDFDPIVMGLSLWKAGRVPRFLAKASLFRVPVLGALLRSLGQIPVERAAGGRASLDAADRLVDQGLAVIIYPEGTLTREPDLWPMRGKSGAVRLALESGVPIIPAAHWGVEQVMPRFSKKLSLAPRKRVDVVFGEPVDLSRWAGRAPDAVVLTEATEAVMAAITTLLQELRGGTPPTVRYDPAAHGQTEFGRPASPA
jgi:1-acyl-sn-glycerol-3-phosphate acyltransferase